MCVCVCVRERERERERERWSMTSLCLSVVLSPDRCSSTDYEIIDNVQTTEDDFVDECEDVSEEKAYHLLLVKMKEQQFNPLGFFQVTGRQDIHLFFTESTCVTFYRCFAII